jgi:hypothetical protein
VPHIKIILRFLEVAILLMNSQAVNGRSKKMAGQICASGKDKNIFHLPPQNLNGISIRSCLAWPGLYI